MEPNPRVTGDAGIESRKIVTFRKAAEYENAYNQIVNWASDEKNVLLLFQRDNVTTVALEICAWKEDYNLFNKIANRSPSMTRTTEALRVASQRNFLVLARYYQCFFKKELQSLSGCEKQIGELVRLNKEYADIWRFTTR